jgi:sugar phosphate permease
LGLLLPRPTGAASDEPDIERTTIRRLILRLCPFLFILYTVNYLDRTNLSFAQLQMLPDLRLTQAVYGVGVGVFYIGYSLFEVPSNLILARVGARRWIARIMVTWGLISSAMMFTRTPMQFYTLRFLLGFAEAGFAPGILYYIGEWFPVAHRGRAVAWVWLAIPLSEVLGGPLSGWLLGFEGRLGLHGWQWLFLVEGLPAVLLGFAVLVLLTDKLEEARWLSADQRVWLADQLERDREGKRVALKSEPLRALADPTIWLLALPWFLVLATGYTALYWTPRVIHDNLHTSHQGTGWIVGAIGVLVALAMLVAGAVSDRRQDRFLYPAASACLMAVGFVGFTVLPKPWGPVAGFALVAIGQRSFQPPFWCTPSLVLRGAAAAAGIGLVNAIGQLGGFFGPYIAGQAASAAGGLQSIVPVLAGVDLIAAAVILLLRRMPAFAPTVRPAIA